MKSHLLLSVLVLVITTRTLAQNCDGRKDGENIAVNGDFEQTYGLCTAHVGLASATTGALGWKGEIGTIEGHTYYLNSCASTGSLGYNPSDNRFGTQAPLNGEGYYAIRVGGAPVGPVEEYKEGYLAHELATPLLKGITYYIEFSVSLADISTNGVKSLGMFLTHDPADLTNLNGWDFNYHHRTPQIPNTFPSTSYYLDYTGWTKICGYYTPVVDGVKYLVIGRFRDEFYESSGSPGYNGQTSGRPIYYVDGVYIHPYSCCSENKYFQNTSSVPTKTSVNNEVVAGYNVVAGTPGNVNITSGQNVTFQSGNQILLEPGFTAQTGSMFSTILAECERGIDDNQLAVVINVDDTTPGQYTLTAVASHGSGGYTYHWSTGSAMASITVTDDPATYTVVATDNVPDASPPAPCNIRTGIGEFIIECISCRHVAVADQPEIVSSGEQLSDAYQVYPNPSNGLFSVKFRKEKVSYGVYSLNGMELLRGANETSLEELMLDLRTKGKGTYLLRIVDDKRKSVSRLIFIQ